MFEIGTLLLSSILIAIISDRIRIPYSVGLMLGGAALSLTDVHVGITLSPDLMQMVILPALIFEAALSLDWESTRDEALNILIIAVTGVLVTMATCAAGLHFLLDWPIAPALVFGSLVAATDPVAVLSVFRNHRVSERLRAVIQGESLINDGLAATLFLLTVAWANGEAVTAATVTWELGKSIGGGIVCGMASAFAASLVAGRTRDGLVEISITILAAYGSYIAAHSMDMSGILASLSAGIVLWQLRPLSSLTQSDQSNVGPFWRFAAFVANSVVFILIGVNEAKMIDLDLALPVLAAFVLMLVARILTVYPVSGTLISRISRPFEASDARILVWGGLRGALPLALALSLPSETPMRATIIPVAFGVVALSMLLQGLSLPFVLRRWKSADAERTEDTAAA